MRLISRFGAAAVRCGSRNGDTRDVVLTAGRAFELALATTAVLSSRDGAEFVLQPVRGEGRAAQALPWSRRLLRALSPRSAGPALRELAGRVRMERAP